MDKLMKVILIMAAAIFIAAGCASKDVVPAHSGSEQKALDELSHMTPQQEIERIQKGPMPESAKAARIQQIKDKNGIK
jgi:PBP1b-binding outer membrane lipoprotein LpoB